MLEGAVQTYSPFFQYRGSERRDDVKAKAKLYGPMLLAALLCALVFATGAMKKPSEFELLNGQYMQLAGGKTRYAVADGDAYGALPGEMAGLHLPAANTA